MPRSKQEAKKRKKRRAHILKDAPFPVPISSMMSEPMPEGAWFYYTGYIEGSSVVIKHTGDIDFLHKMGFFGKGALSRSEPSFQERKQRVNVRVRKLVKGASEPKATMIRGVVTSKRNFLTHKRYKALLDGNGTEYNYIIHCEEQQKLGLEGLSDEEDYTKEDDDEEDDEDEEADSDDGGPRTVVGGGGKRKMMEAFHMLNGSGGQSRLAGEECGSHGRQGFTEASRETRTSVVALLSEVAGLSNEKIATFAKVPFTMSQLRDKYELLRRAEIALIQQKQNQGGRFKPGEVIELDDTEEDGGGGDSVVVLDSDEEEDDEDEENIVGGTAIKSKESGKQEKAGPKGWGEYDDGDDDCWGSADVHTKDIADNLSSTTGSGKGDKDDSNDPSKNKKGAADSKTGSKETENKISSELKQKEKASSEDIDMCKENASEDKGSEVSAVPNGNTLVTGSTGKGALEGGSEEDTTCSQKRLESVEKDKTSTVEGVQNDEALNSGTDSDKAKAHSTEGQASAFTGGLSVDFSSPDKEDDAGVERMETDGDASNDSDDVICIESESATPSSVHNLLSQTRSTVVTKSVTFMSNITTHSTYVTAKVGFGSWDSLIHFNYTGDSTHLPTVMTAESQSAAATRTSNKGSDVSKEVYERLFPPVSTLVPGSKSLGAVIKQRVKGLPCLTSAYLKLSTGGVPVSSSNTIYSSIMATGSSSNNRDPAPSQSGNRQSPQKQQRTRQAKFHQSTPQPFKTPPEKNPAILSSAVSPIAATDTQTFTPEIKATSTSSDSINAAQSSTSKSHFNSEIVTKYLKVLIEPNDSSKDVHNTDTNDVGETNQSSVSILSNLVKQLHHLHFESSSGKSSSLPSSPEATSLLTQFHTLFSEYLSDTGLSPDKEPDFLQSLVSKRENLSPFLDKEVLDSLKKLTGFQVKLLEDRLNHITNKSDGDCIIAEGASPRRKGKDKRKNSDTETSDSKRLKTDNSEEDRVIDPSCNSEVKLLENGIKSTGEKDSTSVELNSSKTGGIPEPTSMDAKNDEAGEDKCKKESVEVSLKSDGRSMEENKNRNLEDSTSENCISESTAGESKGANKGQGNLNDSTVDRISIGSSSEEEDMDDSDSNSDCSIEISAGPSLDARALCRSDDPDGELFVINNTSEEEELEDDGEEAEEAIRNAHRWKPCVKEDPYPVQEKLYLMLEEAFFLSYGLGCLRVLDPEMKLLDLKDMWRQSQVLKEQFVPHYVAYHYFRSKGWVPKSGLKFGCDFILYREGPPFYHGSYSVVVQCVREGSLLPCTRREGYQLDHRHLNWISLAGLNRITEHVAKELMFCYVIWPKGLSREELSSPACISRFKVKEVLVSRWISSQERENKTEEDMP